MSQEADTNSPSVTSLGSASTYAQAKAQYDDNADYDLVDTGGVDKAKAFIEACRVLKRRMPEEVGKGRERARLGENIRQLDAAEDRAIAWLRAHPDFKTPLAQTTTVDLRDMDVQA